MGFIPAIVAICGFILLWSLFNSTQMKKRLEMIKSLKSALAEIELYEKSNQDILQDNKAQMAVNNLQADKQKLRKSLAIESRVYNEMVQRAPTRFLAKALGYKVI
jgi:hypothetical protein